MSRLFTRSLLVLALLFGLVFAVGIAVLYYLKLPLVWAVGFSVVVVGVQYLLSPFLIDWIYHIRWVDFDEFDPEFKSFLTNLCMQRGIPVPRLGLIEDGNPNAFTYGHVPGNARLVVTRGLKDMLSEEELHAVVAHEVGHITHYDFIVMTFAALVPMLLYVLYTWTRNRDRNNNAVAAVAIGAYIAYIISQYIVLFLSRIREYYADEHAAQSVQNANAISTALVKIAYGLARIPQEQEKAKKSKEQSAPASRVGMVGALGICNFKSAGPMAMFATDASGEYSADLMVRAMQWDLWNPWARLFELQSTHPLVARRVMAASQIAQRLGQESIVPASQGLHFNLWPLFWMDMLYLALPWIGVTLGLFLIGGASFFGSDAWIRLYKAAGLVPLLGGIGWLIRLTRSYGNDFRSAAVTDLVAEVEVSHIRSIPVELHGEIIGRGVPGLFWSKDLVMQDGTGFITLIYRQPLGFLETLFGIFRAESLVGKQGVMRGWYRRGPVPYLELASAEFEDGKRITCHYRNFLFVIATLVTIAGAVLLALQMLGGS